MGRVLLKFSEEVFVWGSNDVVDFVHLVELVVAWKKREQRNYLEQHAAHTPKVHFIPIITVSQQAFRRAVPASTDVFRVGLLAVDASARAKVSKLNLIIHQQNVLWFNVSVENAVSMHMVYRLKQLENIVFDSVLR